MPTTPLELYIWLAVQFTVTATVVIVVRWVVLRNGEERRVEIERLEAEHRKTLSEKDARIAERDIQIVEFKAEVKLLRELHFPSLRPDKGSRGGPKP